MDKVRGDPDRGDRHSDLKKNKQIYICIVQYFFIFYFREFIEPLFFSKREQFPVKQCSCIRKGNCFPMFVVSALMKISTVEKYTFK